MIAWQEMRQPSAIFSSVFGYLGGQALVEGFFKSLPLNSFTFMVLAQALIFVLGWPFEWPAIILVFLVMYLFLQNIRATLIPTLVVPVALRPAPLAARAAPPLPLRDGAQLPDRP